MLRPKSPLGKPPGLPAKLLLELRLVFHSENYSNTLFPRIPVQNLLHSHAYTVPSNSGGHSQDQATCVHLFYSSHRHLRPTSACLQTSYLETFQPLPAELGPLPLYPEDNDFYSVLGPPPGDAISEDQASRSAANYLAYDCIDISAALTLPTEKVLCGSSKCRGNRFAPPSTLP